ncbi:MAG: Signal recognition particle protein [Phycisphaerae bacterium]|nr:Signal recognition particle protein [Phycisphaerae bacterium]
MFDQLADKLGNVFRNLRGRGRLTEEHVTEALRDIRTALLEADVSVEVARNFCDQVGTKAIGQEILNTLKPEQVMVKVVHDELVALMGPVDPRIPFVSPGPTILMLAGLQGSGKTTTCAKLAKHIISKGKRPMLVAADLKRPAAIDQLEVLGKQLSIPVYTERGHQDAVKVCRNSISQARRMDRDVVILDTAGRLAIDEEMMAEVAKVADVTQPHQIYLVIDAMTGQDAVNTAKSFNTRLELDGVILTKFDSDTRGGAALTVKTITGKPIKFIGIGEKIDNLEPFHPDRIASRILGMGDVLTLVEQAQQQFDQDEAAKLQKKMAKGALTMEDFLDQFRKVQKMGSIKSLMKMIPGMGGLADMEIDENEIKRMEAIILSMTRKERHDPDLIDSSRRRRIARGAGVDPQEVSGLVKQFTQMRDMMKSMSGLSMMNRMKALSQLGQAAASGQMNLRKMKGSTSAPARRVSSKDKRKERKKHRR